MEKAKEYRAYAETAVDLATRSDDDKHKTILLKIAQGWLDLAQRAETADKKVKIWMSVEENRTLIGGHIEMRDRTPRRS